MEPIVGVEAKIYRIFWCNPTAIEFHPGCGKSFLINQDEILQKIIESKNGKENMIRIKCPYCGHIEDINPAKFSLSEFPYIIQMEDNKNESK